VQTICPTCSFWANLTPVSLKRDAGEIEDIEEMSPLEMDVHQKVVHGDVSWLPDGYRSAGRANRRVYFPPLSWFEGRPPSDAPRLRIIARESKHCDVITLTRTLVCCVCGFCDA